MAAEIKLTKSAESPWGFRLTGGRDFGTPLTIIKVAVGSVAEEAGLQVGDILVKINDEDCPALTHKEAQNLILQSNNAVTFSVLRGNLSLSNEVVDRLTPLPLRDFKTPEPTTQQRIEKHEITQPYEEPVIEVIPIQDLEPEILEELGLNPLPQDFLEKAKRDTSPMPEIRPQSQAAEPQDILEKLEDLGLTDVVQDIERQKEEAFRVTPEVCTEGKPSYTTQDGDTIKNDTLATVSDEPSQTVHQDVGIPRDLIENSTVIPISDEEFAEFISGQEEVIAVEDKKALGVDFKKFEPQADFLRKSQVFRTMIESERIMTREEKDKRWTTFLDKPKGPKPKPKPKQEPQPPEENPPEPAPEVEVVERKCLYEIPSEEEFAALVKVPTPPPEEPVKQVEEEQQPEMENVKQQLQEEQENLQQQLEIEKQLNPEAFGEGKSEIEQQLEEIQRQLQAIQQLPFEIQQHLALVQEQLNKIVQHRQHQEAEDNEPEVPACPRPSMVSPSQIPENLAEIQLETLEESLNEEISQQEAIESKEEVPIETVEKVEKKPEFKLRAEEEPAILPPPKVGDDQETEEKLNPQQSDLEADPQLRILLKSKDLTKARLSRSGEEILADIMQDPNKKERPRKKRPFMGLGPAPRPLILPGGRRWRSPKDAYNDEFIAETLSAQAEIITGTTLGVNFRRYEPKPPGLMHLRDSTVYKMIHDLEDPDVVNKGLASRPEIVPALQDYANATAQAAT